MSIRKRVGCEIVRTRLKIKWRAKCCVLKNKRARVGAKVRCETAVAGYVRAGSFGSALRRWLRCATQEACVHICNGGRNCKVLGSL